MSNFYKDENCIRGFERNIVICHEDEDPGSALYAKPRPIVEAHDEDVFQPNMEFPLSIVVDNQDPIL